MKKTTYRSIAYAIALAATISGIPHGGYAAENNPLKEAASAVPKDMATIDSKKEDPAAAESLGRPVPADAAIVDEKVGKQIANQAPGQQAAGGAVSDARTEEWVRSRPEERAISEYMQPLEGLTIVDVQFEGAGEKTLPTVQQAVSQHAGDVFSVTMAEQDRAAIYNTGYFYDLYPTFEQVPEGVVITYHLLENPILVDVVFTGNSVEKTATLKKLITVPRGEILNSTLLHDNIAAVQEQYRKDGYILAKVADMNMAPDGVLTLKINEGILEGYKVKGNKKTKDKVILREMRQKAGQPFNAKLARRSMQRVYNLGFFEDVNIKMNPGIEPNAVVMEVDVKEKRTGTFGLGAGYSSQDGIIGMISVNDSNFRGTGDAVGIVFQVSGRDTDAHGYSFSYRKPWLDRKETAGTIRLYNRTYKFGDYDTNGDLKERYMRKYSGGELTMSRPKSEYSTNFLTFRNRKDSYVKHVDSGNAGNRSGNKEWLNSNFGTTRSFIFEHVTDTRDNIYNPTEGGRVSLSAEIAGMGGDFNFQKLTIDDQRYRRVGTSQVMAFRLKYGYGRGDISEFNQYTLGGQDTLRGYRDDQFRGDHMFSGTIEYRFPLISKMQGALFTDWGGAWDTGIRPKNMKMSVGIGVAVNTPLGPLRLDYGRGSQGGRVHFSVGGAF